MTPEHEQQHSESSANSLACFIAALQGDRAGLAVMLDEMSWMELRRVAAAALYASADGTLRGNTAPSRDELDGMLDILKAQLAALRAQAMQSG